GAHRHRQRPGRPGPPRSGGGRVPDERDRVRVDRTPAASGMYRARDRELRTRPDVAVGPPANATLELAGPEGQSIAAFVRWALAASGDARAVIADPQARYFGAALDARGLTPVGPNPRIGPTRFEDWLSRSRAG